MCEGRRSRCWPLVGVEIGIGEASVVVDADVEVLVAGAVVEAARSATEHAVAWPGESRHERSLMLVSLPCDQIPVRRSPVRFQTLPVRDLPLEPRQTDALRETGQV